MIIKADEEGKKAIMYLIDVGLRKGLFGVGDVANITTLIQSIEPTKQSRRQKKK